MLFWTTKLILCWFIAQLQNVYDIFRASMNKIIHTLMEQNYCIVIWGFWEAVSDLLCICDTRNLHVVYRIGYEAPLRRLPYRFLFPSTFSWCLYVFSSHILPFPAPFSLCRCKENSLALPIVLPCVPMWASPRTTTLAYSPTAHLSTFFFHKWI